MLDISAIAWGSISPRSAASQYTAAASGFSYKRETTPAAEAPPRATPNARADVHIAPESKESEDVSDSAPEKEKAETVTSASVILAAMTAYGAANESETEQAEPPPSPPVESTSYEAESTSSAGGEPSPAVSAAVYNTVASASNSTVRGVSVSVAV